MQYYQGSVEYFPTKSPYKDNPLSYIFFLNIIISLLFLLSTTFILTFPKLSRLVKLYL